MDIITTITPMDEELADANWIDYVVVRVNAKKGAKAAIEKVIGDKVKYNLHADDKSQMSMYVTAVRSELEKAGLEVLSVEVANGLVWPYVAYEDEEEYDEDDEDEDEIDWDDPDWEAVNN